MKTLKLAACAVVVASSASAETLNLSSVFSSFVALGDSLTDAGRLNDTPFENGPPSLDGRFSNGITFAEDVAQDFAVDVNLAIGGATALDANENPLPPQFGTFGGQVATLDNLTSDPNFRAALGARPLFSVLFGSNDILQNVGLPDAGTPGLGNIAPGIGALAADAVEDNIRAIRSIDAKFNDFVVINLPDIALTPLFTNPVFGAGGLASIASSETTLFNNQLADNIDDLRDDGFNIIEFDLDTLFGELLDEAVANGIDINNPCTFSFSNPDPSQTCVFAPGEPDNIDLALADDFFFVDSIHPNRVAQGAAADAFRATVASSLAPVPLPAGLPLLLAGLGAFGVLRKRRAA